MESGDYGAQPATPAFMKHSWRAALFLGVLTAVLGLIVSFHPTGSLNVLAVLIGIALILSGIFQLIRVFDPAEPHRVWLGIAGLLFIVIGVVLIRHLHLTRALIGLVVGITWIVQGLTALIGGIAGGVREGRAWWIAFGVISLIAGIVVTATPESSITVLAVLIGIWTLIMGIFEIIGAFILRREVRRAEATFAGPQDSAIVLYAACCSASRSCRLARHVDKPTRISSPMATSATTLSTAFVPMFPDALRDFFTKEVRKPDIHPDPAGTCDQCSQYEYLETHPDDPGDKAGNVTDAIRAARVALPMT